MKEVYNKDEFNDKEEITKKEYKDKEEIDAYFKDVRKRGFPAKFFLILILFLIVLAGAYYYIIIDSPQNILFMSIKDKFSNINLTYNETINYDYELDLNVITNNKEYIDISNILNKFYLTGKLGIDKEDVFIKLNTFYEQKSLLSLDIYHPSDNYTYLKLNDLYDKIIKTKDEPAEESVNDLDRKSSKEVLNKTINSTIKIMSDTLKNAEYKKEYTKLNEKIVKKVSFIIDEELTKELYNNMLNDQEFIENYSKIQDMTEKELIESLKEEKANLKDFQETIYLYVTPIYNNFLKLEIIEDEYKAVISKEDEEYQYKIYNNSIIKYQGYITIEKDGNDFEFSSTIEDIEEQITIEFNLDLSYDSDTKIDSFDKTNAIDVDSLTEKDTNKIMENLMKNEAFKKLVEDINSISSSLLNNENYFQTT